MYETVHISYFKGTYLFITYIMVSARLSKYNGLDIKYLTFIITHQIFYQKNYKQNYCLTETLKISSGALSVIGTMTQIIT